MKDWKLNCSIPEAIDLFYTFVVKRPSRFRKALIPKVQLSEFIMKVMKGLQPVSEMNNLIKLLGHQIPQLTEDEAQNVLSNVVVELFAESNPEGAVDDDKGKSSKPLGLLAMQLVMIITSPEFEGESKALLGGHSFVSTDLPILDQYGQIESKFLEMRERARRVDTIHSGEWPLLLKAMLLPVSDQVFYSRGSEMIPFSSSIIGKRLEQRFLLLASPMGRRLLGR